MANGLAYLYFFFNGAGLAGGLLYTNLLTPFFYTWLLFKKKRPVLLPFLIVLLPFDLIHIINGVEWKSFLVSNLLFISTYIFVESSRYFINHHHNMPLLFKRILVFNFIFTLIASLIYFTPYQHLLWYTNKFTSSVNDFKRLALLTFEASYYALLFTPVAFYYLLKLVLRQYVMPAVYILLLVLVPLLLSLSLGVLGAMAISFLVFYTINRDKVLYKKSFFTTIALAFLLTISCAFFLFIFFPENALFIRLNNVFTGIDTSTRGRTSDSFMMAWKVAGEKSYLFGAGLGQIKVLAHDIVKKYFNYWGELDIVRIPNAVAETLAVFGIAGLVIRFSLLFYLFFKTRVLSNHYRTLLFVFMFVYQFTGSYITNIVEYMIWVIAFSDVFASFNRQPVQKTGEHELQQCTV